MVEIWYYVRMKRKQILYFLSDVGRTSAEIASFLIGGGFGRQRGIRAGFAAAQQVRQQYDKKHFDEHQKRLEWKRAQRLIQALKQDGLIKSTRIGREAHYSMTQAGKTWVHEHENDLSDIVRAKKYVATPSDRVTIIAYDIPHTMRQQRDWLRGALGQFGFRFLQRSLFIGKRQIPESFIDDLAEANLTQYVDIFEITKSGTLRFPGKNLQVKI